MTKKSKKKITLQQYVVEQAREAMISEVEVQERIVKAIKSSIKASQERIEETIDEIVRDYLKDPDPALRKAVEEAVKAEILKRLPRIAKTHVEELYLTDGY